MNIKEMTNKMQLIEFVLFTLKNGDGGKLHTGELGDAHEKAREIIKNYCEPNGGMDG